MSMPTPPSGESRDEAIKRLSDSASALETRAARQVYDHGAHAAASSQAWRILADLFGGVFVGLALGFILDRFAGTGPWGLIGGVLLGFAVSVFMAWRTAQSLMARARLEGEPKSVPFDDEDEGA